MKADIKIPIQSISDIITNSSSELFCTSTSDTCLEDIFRAFKAILSEWDLYGDAVTINRGETDDGKPTNCLEIWIHYDAGNHSSFIRAEIEAILDKGFGNNYQVMFK